MNQILTSHTIIFDQWESLSWKQVITSSAISQLINYHSYWIKFVHGSEPLEIFFHFLQEVGRGWTSGKEEKGVIKPQFKSQISGYEQTYGYLDMIWLTLEIECILKRIGHAGSPPSAISYIWSAWHWEPLMLTLRSLRYSRHFLKLPTEVKNTELSEAILLEMLSKPTVL